jgi:hypothetical protein
MGGEGKDEDSRKKAMANLAMIGLAIAAGQSPDALTNIAQGALSGMQAMTAQEARERDLEREARLTALEMTEKAADRASAERIAAMRLGTAGEDTRQEYLYNATFSATLTGLIGEGIPAEEAATRAAAIAAHLIVHCVPTTKREPPAPFQLLEQPPVSSRTLKKRFSDYKGSTWLRTKS